MDLIEPDLLETDREAVEKAIDACVADFYGKARKDALLGPIFNAKVHDWDAHLRTIGDFWSRALLRTARYDASPFTVHMRLPLELEHFERWLELFEASARDLLPPPYNAKAVAKARHMAESFKVGLFPFIGKDGRPARLPG